MALYSQNDFQKLFDVSRETFEQVVLYHNFLQKWNKAINLVSPKTLGEVWHRHLIDSAQVVKYIPDDIKIYADLGCGGGFPGLIVAMMRPDLNVHLVESDERKCQFMRTVKREAGLSNVSIHTMRIEDSYDEFTPDFVTARALASLDKLMLWCMPWVAQNNDLRFGFLKGGRADEEISQAQTEYDFSYACYPSITDPDAQIIVLSSLTEKS